MSNLVPSVKIKLDKVRHLRFDLNAMVSCERASGKSLKAFEENLPMEQLLYLLWACLLHEDKELTLDYVGAMVHPGNMDEVTDAINKAYDASQPEVKDDPKN